MTRVAPGSIAVNYELNSHTFVKSGRLNNLFVVKDFNCSEITRLLKYPYLGDLSSAMERLVTHLPQGDLTDAVLWLESCGIALPHARLMVHGPGAVPDHYSPLQLALNYLHDRPRDLGSVRDVCAPVLESALDEFLDAGPVHIDAFLWISGYLTDLFWTGRLHFLPEKLPSDYNNDKFEINIPLFSGNSRIVPGIHVRTATKYDWDVAGDFDSICSILQLNPPASGTSRWFHGTSRASADSIIQGILIEKGSMNMDFGRTSSFYLSTTYKDAKNWACRRKNILIPAVLVFDVRDSDLLAHEPFQVFDKAADAWKILVHDSRTTDRNIPSNAAESAEKCAWIYGPIASIPHNFYSDNFNRKNWDPRAIDDTEQLALKNDNIARLFHSSLAGIILLAPRGLGMRQ